jgi:uncharacterized protein (UPF0335 family)
MNAPTPAGHNSKAQLLAFVDRLVSLEEEIKAFQEDVRELKKEAKAVGVNPKTLAALAKLKRKGKEDALNARDVYDQYLMTLSWLD